MKKIYLRAMALMVMLILVGASLMLAGASAWAAETTPPPAAPPLIDLTPLLQAIISVAVALVTYRLLPWIKQRTTAGQREGMLAMVRTLVYAAQQLYKTGEVVDRFSYVEAGLRDRGYNVDRDAIEAAVRELNLTNGILIPDNAIIKEVASND